MMKKSTLLLFSYVFLLSAAFAQVELHLKLDSTQIYVGHSAKPTIELVNNGKTPVVLVLPGDGSWAKLRTPFVGWSMISTGWPNRKHPVEPPLPKGLIECANINDLDDDEIFTLEPGETRAIDDLSAGLVFKKPGKYRVVYYYHNDPTIPFLYPMNENRMKQNPALRKMINSDKCLLRSNEVIVEVMRAPK